MRNNPDEIKPQWCIIGNITKEHAFGEEKEIRQGTKHFKPMAKVYCLAPQWHWFDDIKVIGRHRKSGKYITLIMPSMLIENLRINLVYSPEVLRRINEHGCPWPDKETAEELLVHLNLRRINEKYTDRDFRSALQEYRGLPPLPPAPWWMFWKKD
ncbi:MAG: hypothetical protein JXR97_09980 [Planctomycetes bacterium]|nr:hypothetical protein [Planctomycetota bacterium]